MTDLISSNCLIKTGPAGRAMAQPMDNDLLQLLYQHITMERNASSQYFGMSLWMEERELKGFAKFYKSECFNEQKHSYVFSNYLIGRGQTVVLDAIPSPRQTWDSVESLVADSFQMEADITSSLNQLYSIAERSSDTRTSVFLDPIVEGQISSEDELAHLYGKVKFAANQPSAILIIDSELSRYE